MDLCNEHLNNDFKEMLKHSRGRYTDAQVKRCSQLSGEYGKLFHSTFAQSIGKGHPLTHKKSNSPYKKDLEVFVEDFQGDALFDYLPVREHKAFPEFVWTQKIKDPVKLGKKLKAHSQTLDFWKRRAQNHRQLPCQEEI